MPHPAAALAARFPLGPCGRFDHPGVGLDRPDLVDFSALPVTTPDQQRIEDVLAAADLTGKDLLHVGVGNSQLARRLAPRCRWVDGVTVAAAERDRGVALGIPNYRVQRANKYAVSLPAVLNRHFDAIVDNNLASFACCGFHLLVMLSSYRLMLRPGGRILTDRQGMEWTAGDDRWRLTYADLELIAAAFDLVPGRVTETVYALTRR